MRGLSASPSRRCEADTQDWLHESCLDLTPASTRASHTPAAADDDGEDDEGEVLIPSESYDGLICASCVSGNAFLQEKAGQAGWMVIEPGEDGAFRVVGREEKPKSDGRGSVSVDEAGGPAAATAEEENSSENAEGSLKRPAETIAEDEVTAKKPRLDTAIALSGTSTEASLRKGKGDIFLAHGVRSALKASLPVSRHAAQIDGS